MVEPFYTVCRVLHVGGGWLAFASGAVALGAAKGSRAHILAGRCFALSMAIGVTAGILLSIFRTDPTLQEPVQFGVVMGGFGLWMTGRHAWWRGPAQPSRWRVEHLTSFLAAYTVSWSFITGSTSRCCQSQLEC